ncbi:S9 family peptidase [Trueperella pecoris]|uniref:S9 family peptidase n=1 Tax=Trueperella pecoris TaxID=2733571 RepID=UPI001ABE31C1|nr:S9 family peptidase [Trueperella pecoris]QTG75529.1 S9 family peptidase [Trueperella pecoris]
MTNLNAGAPRAQRIPYERHFHGQTFIDYYEWMREDDSRVCEHIDAENAWFDENTRDQQGLREQIVAEIASRTKETDVSVPVRQGDYWYWSRTWEGRPYEGLFRVPVNGMKQTEKASGERPQPGTAGAGETCVYDANQLGAHEEYFATGSSEVSPDGRLFALAMDTTGDEHFKLRIHEIESDVVVDDAVEGIGYGLVWLADSSGVFYTRVDDAWRPHEVWLHRVGTSPEEDVLICQENDEMYNLWIEASREGTWMVVSAASTDTTEVRLISTVTLEEILVRPRQQGVSYWVEPAGDELLICHNVNEIGFEVASAPVRPSEPKEWLSLVKPAKGERIFDVTAFKDFAAFEMRSNGGTQIRVMERAEKDWEESYVVPIPETMTVEFAANPEWESTVIDVVAESLIQPRTWMSWDVENKKLETLKRLDVPGYDPDSYVEYREWATAADGVKIPMTIAHRADLDRKGTNPGFIYGYGSYEVSNDPYFTAMRLPLLDRGVVYAVAHIRGGGEMGREWYEDGRLLKKKNTFTDFVAASRQLVDSGLVDGGRLAAEGRSAGGLLMGAVTNLAPELYRVILAGVPFVDALTTILKPELPLTVGEWEEWGNPIESAEVYDYMAQYSPYENIRAVRYPAILATTSLNDVRVSYLEPTKWIQELRNTVAEDSGMILQYTEKVAGHAGGSGRYSRWERRARELAFVLRQLGVA